MEITQALQEAFVAHTAAAYPAEACGLVVEAPEGLRYVPCDNVADSPDQEFRIHPKQWLQAEAHGPIVAVFHSHPDADFKPSAFDLAAMPATDVPWVIMGWPGGLMSVTRPAPQPLVGRAFVHGVTDCFTLIRDYYRQELGLLLPEVWHGYDWWAEGGNLYLDNIEAAGFARVHTPRKHDVILMTVAGPVPNHGAVYLGDGLILHHFAKRLSRRELYTGIWQKATYGYYRHRELG